MPCGADLFVVRAHAIQDSTFWTGQMLLNGGTAVGR